MVIDTCKELSDSAVVERVQRGDHLAFGELVARHDRRLRAVAGRLLRNPERVDDAMQEVYSLKRARRHLRRVERLAAGAAA